MRIPTPPQNMGKLALGLLSIANLVLLSLTVLNYTSREIIHSQSPPSFLLPVRLPVTATGYTYLGDSFPSTVPLRSSLSSLPSISYTFESSTRYTPTSSSLPSWFASLPHQLGYIRLGPNKRIFAISMSHASHCVYLFAKAIAEDWLSADEGGNEEHLHHCLNYVRQHLLCEADTMLEEYGWLESAKQGVIGTGGGRERVCRDWREVYELVERNYWEWMKFREQNWRGDN
ncbi:hypothetical protein EW146_g7117 [Bondarzewia mesenterica]|uniref:Uncharacterized protein n=1 Tax=Bondarzewia mesenterica TaxID=1095465 RepID=A0A4S4LNI1_9AGAM|nr:hypothetical protein EW146_g7117 [Bondarzewia mesenterica]